MCIAILVDFGNSRQFPDCIRLWLLATEVVCRYGPWSDVVASASRIDHMVTSINTRVIQRLNEIQLTTLTRRLTIDDLNLLYCLTVSIGL